jgi:DNA-binding NarL/FixJ family response regulator
MTTSRQIRVVVADDFPLMRAALVESWRRDPRIDVVGQAADGAEAIALVEAERPDVLACDLEMPVLDGQQVVEHLRASPTRVLIVTGTDSPEAMMRAIDAGAAGFMTKHSSVSELREAVLAVMRGETPIAPHLACALVRELRAPSSRSRHRISGRGRGRCASSAR